MPRYTHAELAKLSPMTKARAADFMRDWSDLSVAERRRIARTLVQLAEENVELDYNDLYLRLLEDPDAAIRTMAIEGLWEDERATTADALIDMVHGDPDEAVRSIAVKAVGRFAYRLALGELASPLAARVRETVLEAAGPTMPIALRRRAIEAAGYLTSDDAATALIRESYRSDSPALRASAIAAMGRTCDVSWLNNVLRELESEDPEMRFEAAQAAGELEDERAVPQLIRATRDEDAEVRLASVAALGAIGGQRAKETLLQIRNSDDEALSEAADTALETMDTGVDPLGFRVRDINPN